MRSYEEVTLVTTNHKKSAASIIVKKLMKGQTIKSCKTNEWKFSKYVWQGTELAYLEPRPIT